MKKIVLSFLLLFTAMQAQAANAPAWFNRDIQRRAAWLPSDIKTLGVDGAYQKHMDAFPDDIRATLQQMQIPSWLIALVPVGGEQQDEIFKQFRFMGDLAGAPGQSPLAQRAEQLLIFGGAAQLPTPGDAQTGRSLGAEGCTAAMSKYILAELKLEFPSELASMSDQLANSQSSAQMKALFLQASRSGASWLHVRDIPFNQLQTSDIEAGSLMIAQKPGGTHTFGWTRVPSGWGWSQGDKMAVGNTGLPQFGDRMILAQEFVTDDPANPDELAHNQHGPINSHDVIYVDGQPDLSDPRTNVYAAEGSDFIVIDLR